MAQCPECGSELKVVQTCCSALYWCTQCEQAYTPDKVIPAQTESEDILRKKEICAEPVEE